MPLNALLACRARKVVRLAAFGCFVEICPGRDGLLHSSELADTPVADIASVVQVGQDVDVMVLSSDNGKVGKQAGGRAVGAEAPAMWAPRERAMGM